jgi:SprT protein
MAVKPIGTGEQQRVRRATADCLRRAGEACGQDFPLIPVTFDLLGSAAGMYRVRHGRRSIRYNPYLFAKFFDDNLAVTVPHEVAHYVTDLLYGQHGVRPHGAQWQAVMRSLGVEPRASADYDLTGIPVRRQHRYPYTCGCTVHQLTARRHNKVHRGEAVYRCRRCGVALVEADHRARRPSQAGTG